MQAEGPDVGSILTIWDDVSEPEMRVLKVSGIPQANSLIVARQQDDGEIGMTTDVALDRKRERRALSIKQLE